MQSLGQSHYRITKIRAEGKSINITLTCENFQEITISLTIAETQILIHELQWQLDDAMLR